MRVSARPQNAIYYQTLVVPNSPVLPLLSPTLPRPSPFAQRVPALERKTLEEIFAGFEDLPDARQMAAGSAHVHEVRVGDAEEN